MRRHTAFLKSATDDTQIGFRSASLCAIQPARLPERSFGIASSKQSGTPTGLSTSREAPVSEMLRTAQSIAPSRTRSCPRASRLREPETRYRAIFVFAENDNSLLSIVLQFLKKWGTGRELGSLELIQEVSGDESRRQSHPYTHRYRRA